LGNPWTEGCPCPETLQTLKSLKEGLLRRILHVPAIPEEATHDPEHQPLVPADEDPECLAIPPQGLLHQGSIIGVTGIWLPPTRFAHLFNLQYGCGPEIVTGSGLQPCGNPAPERPLAEGGSSRHERLSTGKESREAGQEGDNDKQPDAGQDPQRHAEAPPPADPAVGARPPPFFLIQFAQFVRWAWHPKEYSAV
jgi:hypothetical protein